MIELKLIGVRFNVQPISDPEGGEGKQLNFMHDASQTTYSIPMAQNAADLLIADLGMSNDELDKKIQQVLLSAQLEVPPNGAVDLDALRRGPSDPQ